jgi:hypothetical protein
MIELKAVEDVHDEHVQTDAFPPPCENAILHYLVTDPDPSYSAYLVKVTNLTNAHIEFRAISRATGQLGETVHSIEFKNSWDVWPGSPSLSLANWDANNSCTVLFLSGTYADPKQDLQAAKGDGGKWPRGAGDKLFDPVAVRDLNDVKNRLRIYSLQVEKDPKLSSIFKQMFVDYIP